MADGRALRATLLEEIRRKVPFDAYAWLFTDPETEVGSDPLADVPCQPELPTLIRLKYATETNRWTRLPRPVARLHADSGGHPEQSLVWRELLHRYDVADVASMVFRDRFGCWGFLDLWRIGAGRLFSDREAQHLAGLVPALTETLRHSRAETFRAGQSQRLPAGPAVLVLAPDLEVRAQTLETETYLRALLPTAQDQRPIPAGAYNVAAQLLAQEAGVDSHQPRSRVHLREGAWLTLSAARMQGSEDIAVSIAPASAADRLALFVRAFGLSARESDVVAALAKGADTRHAAGSLFISENTLQDHLKSVFDKTGARSRRALLGLVLGVP